MKYLSNFNSLEFGGKFYDFGEPVNVRKGEERAADNLVREGRLTAIEDGDPEVPAGAAPDTTASSPNGDLASMTKAELLEAARAEGVPDVTADNNKAEIVAKIEASRG